MAIQKKRGTINQAEQGRRTKEAQPSGKRDIPVRRPPAQGGGCPDSVQVPNEGKLLAGLEQKLKRATRRLESFQTIGRQQRAFLSLQSHQIRAQLHAVMGYTELVLRKTQGQLPASQEENLKKLLLSVEGLKEAIEGLGGFPLLDLKKPPANKIQGPNDESRYLLKG